jgi:peptidoglycan/LPS O-acetylase OafA/YrhL
MQATLPVADRDHLRRWAIREVPAEIGGGLGLTQGTSARHVGIDIGRCLAVACIVLMHSISGDTHSTVLDRLLLWGVPYLLIVSGWLAGGPGSDDWTWLRRRVLRLILMLAPFLVLGRIIKQVVEQSPYTLKQALADVTIGAAWPHLWFMTVLIAVTVLTWVLAHYTRALRVGLAVASATTVTILLWMPFTSERIQDYLYRTAGLWLSAYLYGYLMRRNMAPVPSKPMAITALAAAMGFVLLPLAYPQAEKSAFVAAALLMSIPAWLLFSTMRAHSTLWSRLGAASAVVYLAHPFVIYWLTSAVLPALAFHLPVAAEFATKCGSALALPLAGALVAQSAAKTIARRRAA